MTPDPLEEYLALLEAYTGSVIDAPAFVSGFLGSYRADTAARTPEASEVLDGLLADVEGHGPRAVGDPTGDDLRIQATERLRQLRALQRPVTCAVRAAVATYERPPDATVEDVRTALRLGDPAATASALVGVTLGGSDPAGVEQLCWELLDSPDRTVAGVAATCLGHVARLEGALTEESVTALRAHRSDTGIGGQVSDALDDVDTFTRRSD